MAILPTFARMQAHEIVRHGVSVRVTLRGSSAVAVGAAAREMQRHLRVAALAGFVMPLESGPELIAGAWSYTATGYTWRASGSEYTVQQLATACAGAYAAAGGSGSLALFCDVVAGALTSVGLGLNESLDPRNSGGLAERTGAVTGAVADGVIGVVEGTGNAARGLGGVAAGFGEGAGAFGGLARDLPLLTFTIVAGLGLFLLVRK